MPEQSGYDPCHGNPDQDSHKVDPNPSGPTSLVGKSSTAAGVGIDGGGKDVRGDTEYCRVEVDFLLFDPRFISLTPLHKVIYLTVWALAVKERQTGWFFDSMWPSRRRSIASAVGCRPCEVDSGLGAAEERKLIDKVSDGERQGIEIVAVARKHKRLLGWRDPYGEAIPYRESKRERESKNTPLTPQVGKPVRKSLRKKAEPVEQPELPLDGPEDDGPEVTGQTVIASWIDWSRRIRGIDPVVGGKDRSAAKRLPEFLQTPEDLARVMELFVHDNDFFLEKTGWALWTLEARINGYRDGNGWKEADDGRPGYDRPYRGQDDRETPRETRHRGESDFKSLSEL